MSASFQKYKPELLTIELDKAAYFPGDTISVTTIPNNHGGLRLNLCDLFITLNLKRMYVIIILGLGGHHHD